MEASSRKQTRRFVLASAVATTWLGLSRVGAADPSPNALVRRLLDRNHQLHPEYGGGLANHFSMGLRSLAALGGSTKQLQAFADEQWGALEPLPKEGGGPVVNATTWARLLGRRQALPGFRKFLNDEIERRGRDETLRRILPSLLPGIGAGAFHALIRTAYGVRFKDDKEVVDGLSYWAIAFQPLGSLGPTAGDREPLAVLQDVQRSPTLSGRDPTGNLIVGRMKTASSLPGFARFAAAVTDDKSALQPMAAAAARLYVATGNFTVLHMVTGANALRTLLPYLDAADGTQSAGMRYFWQALLAAYITLGAPPIEEPKTTVVPDWPTIIKKTASSTDEHDLKLVDIAREEETHWRAPIYRQVAARRMRLL